MDKFSMNHETAAHNIAAAFAIKRTMGMDEIVFDDDSDTPQWHIYVEDVVSTYETAYKTAMTVLSGSDPEP